MALDLILRNAKTIFSDYQSDSYSHEWKTVDIGIKGQAIVQINSKITETASKEIDCTNQLVLPGVIDSQVHFREPGLEHKEDLESGTRGAVAGGVTSIFEMPNTKPLTITADTIQDKINRAEGRAWCDFAFFAGATPSNSDLLVELEKYPGVVGVKIFMGSSTGDLLVDEDTHLEKVLSKGSCRIAVHCEDEPRLKERFSLVEKGASPEMHRIWRDEETALKATRRITDLALKTKRNIHTLHITTAQEIHLLRHLKTQAIHKDHITVEVLPQHLTLSAPDAYEKLGTKAQMNPPIRSKYHQDELWKGINDGTVDMLGSDHAPHTLEEKSKPYPQSPSGMTGVQTILPIMLNHVNNGRLTLERLIELLCLEPSRLYQAHELGPMREGRRANITIIDMNKEFTIEDTWIESKSQWTPYHGWTTKGWPTHTIVGGNIVMEDGKLHEKGHGTPVKFTR